jgi:ring-1,2-phenylacetyl-CoA epoxidase subunit PaaD
MTADVARPTRAPGEPHGESERSSPVPGEPSREPAAVADRVRAAVAAVVDPEYPGITIADLGILEAVRVVAYPGVVGAEVDLVPTVLGCPALHVIEADVVAAARAAGAGEVAVRFLSRPAWTPDRIRPAARAALAGELTVAIRRRDGSVVCPVCGSTAVRQRSAFGATLCRELWWCEACRNPVEVVRR